MKICFNYVDIRYTPLKSSISRVSYVVIDLSSAHACHHYGLNHSALLSFPSSSWVSCKTPLWETTHQIVWRKELPVLIRQVAAKDFAQRHCRDSELKWLKSDSIAKYCIKYCELCLSTILNRLTFSLLTIIKYFSIKNKWYCGSSCNFNNLRSDLSMISWFKKHILYLDNFLWRK